MKKWWRVTKINIFYQTLSVYLIGSTILHKHKNTFAKNHIFSWKHVKVCVSVCLCIWNVSSPWVRTFLVTLPILADFDFRSFYFTYFLPLQIILSSIYSFLFWSLYWGKLYSLLYTLFSFGVYTEVNCAQNWNVFNNNSFYWRDIENN